MSDFKNILEKQYIKGKPIEDLRVYAKDKGVSEEEINSVLLSIHNEYWPKRRNIADRDLFIALLAIVYALYWVYLMMFKGVKTANLLFIVSLFIWIPFLKSFYVVMTTATKFTK